MLCCIINSKSQWLKTKDLLFFQSTCPLRIVWGEADQGSHLLEHYITMSKVRWTTEGFLCCDIKVAHIISIHITWLKLERIHPTIRATENFILQGAWMMESRRRLPLMTSQIPNWQNLVPHPSFSYLTCISFFFFLQFKYLLIGFSIVIMDIPTYRTREDEDTLFPQSHLHFNKWLLNSKKTKSAEIHQWILTSVSTF